VRLSGVLLASALGLLVGCHRGCVNHSGKEAEFTSQKIPGVTVLGGSNKPARLSPAPSSPWLAWKDHPPQTGALGWITFVRTPFWVQWVEDGELDRIDGTGLVQYAFTEGGLPDRGPDIGVFDAVDGANLVWGPKGWAWILPGQEGVLSLSKAELCPIRMALRENSYNLSKEALEPNLDGYRFVLGELVRLRGPIEVYTAPELAASKVRTLPAQWPRRAAEWVKPWSDWQHLSEAGSLPGMAALRYIKTSKWAGTVTPLTAGKTLLKVHEIRGDWALVSAPVEGTPVIAVDNPSNAPIENPGYLILWPERPHGWIRWLIPGPIPGTKLCAIETEWVGIVD